MDLLTEKQVKAIVSNLIEACSDISKLSKAGYNYIYLASGFIVHYDINGFMSAYGQRGSLRDAMLRHKQNNQWSNFHPGERDYDYYMQKHDIYNAVCEALESQQVYQFTVQERIVNYLTVSVIANSENEAREMALRSPRAHMVMNIVNGSLDYYAHPATEVPA